MLGWLAAALCVRVCVNCLRRHLEFFDKTFRFPATTVSQHFWSIGGARVVVDDSRIGGRGGELAGWLVVYLAGSSSLHS